MSEAHYNEMISLVEDYLDDVEELESKLRGLVEVLREARDKGAEPITLEFGDLPDFWHLTEEANFMWGSVFDVLHPEP